MLAAQEEVNDCYDEESYDSEDSLDTSLSEELDTFYGQDATMDDSYKDELAIVPYVKHEVVAIAPTLDCPIILLKSPTHITENFALIKAHSDGMHLPYDSNDFIENNTHALVGHDQHALCDSYILYVVHDTTENYFERERLVVETSILLKLLSLC